MSSRPDHHRRPARAKGTGFRRPIIARRERLEAPRSVTVAPFDPAHLDVVLSVMAGLDDHTLIHVAPDGDAHATVGVRQIPHDPRCAGAGMFGLRAPEDATIVGLSFRARSGSTYFPHGQGGDAGRDRTRVEVVVSASGLIDARIHPSDAETFAVVEAPNGVVVDALHRLMGRPVPGERPPLTALVAGMWMAEILRPPAGRTAPKWSEVAAAHDPMAEHDGVRLITPTTPEQVAEQMQQLVDEASWRDLHRAAAIGRMTTPELTAEEAAWMDTTMFARWMTDSFPAPAAAVAQLRRRGATDAADGIVATLALLDPPPDMAPGPHDDEELPEAG